MITRTVKSNGGEVTFSLHFGVMRKINRIVGGDSLDELIKSSRSLPTVDQFVDRSFPMWQATPGNHDKTMEEYEKVLKDFDSIGDLYVAYNEVLKEGLEVTQEPGEVEKKKVKP